MKKLLTFLLLLSVLFSLPLTAYAHDVPQDRDDCSIEVTVRYNEENVDGGTLTAIKIGYVAEEDGNYFFRQEMTDEKLEDITSPEAPALQQEFYAANKETYEFYTQTQPVEDGKATFTDLSTGLYLIVQEKAAYGFSKLGTFLISVPYMQDGQYQYHVTATIKSELHREPEPTAPPPTVPDDPSLPQTGQLNWPVPVLAVGGMALIVLGCFLRFRKKESHES